jgi:hypothetical protein
MAKSSRKILPLLEATIGCLISSKRSLSSLFSYFLVYSLIFLDRIPRILSFGIRVLVSGRSVGCRIVLGAIVAAGLALSVLENPWLLLGIFSFFL